MRSLEERINRVIQQAIVFFEKEIKDIQDWMGKNLKYSEEFRTKAKRKDELYEALANALRTQNEPPK